MKTDSQSGIITISDTENDVGKFHYDLISILQQIRTYKKKENNDEEKKYAVEKKKKKPKHLFENEYDRKEGPRN